MNIHEMQRVLRSITYKDWNFRLVRKADRIWLRVEYMGFTPDGHNVPQMVNKCGQKWMLSEAMMPSKIIQIAFKAVLTAERKELNQRFCVDGEPYFNPPESPFSRGYKPDDRCEEAADRFEDLPIRSLSEPWPKEGITKMTNESHK